jgi:hypothetical protein
MVITGNQLGTVRLTTCPPVPPDLLSGLTLIILAPGREPAAELEMPLIEYSVTSGRGAPVSAPKSVHHIRHDCGRLPLAGRDARIQVCRA